MLLPVPFVLQGIIKLLICFLWLLSHNTIHREHKRCEVGSSLKASLNIFSLFTPLVLKQYFVWVYPVVVFFVCFNNVNVEDTHPKRVPESNHYCIPIEVSSNLAFLCIGIPPCVLSPATPAPSGSCFQWFCGLPFVCV